MGKPKASVARKRSEPITGDSELLDMEDILELFGALTGIVFRK